MNFNDYVKGLEKISIQDIKKILDEELNSNSENVYGFRNQRGYIFFGELMNGFVINPYVLETDNEDSLCQELYDLIQNEYATISSYSYEHSMFGEYDYFAKLGEDVQVYFPNLNKAHQEWIFNQCHKIDKKISF